ncbi:helix-turn-helix domain-containing protein [Aliarcobacter butzleri]
MQNLTPEELYKRIGKNVAKFRKQKGLSQLDLSLAMGYKSVSVVSGAEIYYNSKHFNLEHLLKISQILDIEIAEFLKP